MCNIFTRLLFLGVRAVVTAVRSEVAPAAAGWKLSLHALGIVEVAPVAAPAADLVYFVPLNTAAFCWELTEREDQASRNARKRGYHAQLVRLLNEPEVKEQLTKDWSTKVSGCPGTVREHVACGKKSFIGRSCNFPLCPWCQGTQAKRLVKRIAPVVATMKSPNLWTFSGGPNLSNLTSEAVSALGQVMAAMHNLAYIKKKCRGGFRKLEVTNKGRGWNLHVHELVDADWVALYPQWDIAPPSSTRFKPYTAAERYAKPVKHPGLAVLFTKGCQKYPELRSPESNPFDEAVPESWYICDVRVATYSPEAEIAKYNAKGNEVVEAGGGAVLDYLEAFRGKRKIQGFGSCYDVKLTDDEEKEPLPPRNGDCPWEDCPSPWDPEWRFVSFGYPSILEYQMDRNAETGTSCLVPVHDG